MSIFEDFAAVVRPASVAGPLSVQGQAGVDIGLGISELDLEGR
jgi:hypothetical protein